MAFGAAQQPPVVDDAAADAGAEDHAEHEPVAGAGAVGRFRQREAVRVVLDPDLAASAAPRSRANGRPFSAVEFALLIRPVAGDTAPGVPMPTSRGLPELGFEIGDEVAHRVDIVR